MHIVLKSKKGCVFRKSQKTNEMTYQMMSAYIFCRASIVIDQKKTKYLNDNQNKMKNKLKY